MEVENRVLEEAEMSFAMAPRAGNGHEVGGKFLYDNGEEFVGRLSKFKLELHRRWIIGRGGPKRLDQFC